MKINKIDNSTTFEKAKIPRYLYHITTPQNFEMIKSRRLMQPFLDVLSGNFNGIFLLDLKNFIKRWMQDKIGDYRRLDEDLIKQCSHSGKDIILLKIATKNLDKTVLRIRSMNKIFSGKKCFLHNSHMNYGDYAKNQSLYTKRKEALEYFYLKYIPIENVQVIGRADNYMENMKNNGARDVIAKLVKNCPEEKMIRQ